MMGCVFEQQLGLLLFTVPPLSRHFCSVLLSLHFGPLLVVTQQVTKPGFPHVDLAAHFFTLPLQFFGSRGGSAFARSFATPATQLT